MSQPALEVVVLTLFPEMFPGPLGVSLAGKALKDGLWTLEALNIRDFAEDKHGSVDDTPYGGGAGMVMRPDVVGRAIDAALEKLPGATLIHLTPRGTPLTQERVRALVASSYHIQHLLGEGSPPPQAGELSAGAHKSTRLILLCGRFEGIDERINSHYQPLEISLGDFVLFGGEVAAMALLEALLRQCDGALGNPQTLEEESFSIGENSALLLEYPHYTKPPLWKGLNVPEALVSGHHAKIRQWRREQAEAVTRERRPDLWEAYHAKQDKP
jgi:tRNA (guanine37-N1)-methyltransferase